MPLPVDLTTITVTGDFPSGAGSPLSGVVTFTPSVDLTDSAGHVIIRAAPVEASLDYTGSFSQVLVCTDNADLSPTGWTWTVTERITSLPVRTYSVLLPASDGPSIDLSELVQVTPVPPPSGALLAVNNLADVDSPSVSRGNLGLADIAILANPGGTTQFLRGDLTWDVPAGGGGGGSVDTVNGVAPDGSGNVQLTAGNVGADTAGAAAAAQTAAISAAEANAAATYIPLTSAGANSGVATLDSNGHLTTGQDANLLKTSQLGAVGGAASLDGSGHLAAAQAANLVSLSGSQTVAGVKAFTSPPTGPAPVGASDLVPKSYADSIAQGLSVKASARLATASALPANTYSNGSSGLGATLTATGTGTLTVDGATVALGDRILVQNEAAPANNGLYQCTTAGAGGVAYVLTRTLDMDLAAQIPGAFAFVESGTVNAGAGFVVAGAGPYVVGTTAIAWTQFSGAGEITTGAGLTKSGNTISLTAPVPVNLGGTGQASAQAALNALAGALTAGRYLRGDGTNVTLAAIQAADVPTLNQSTTGTAAGLSTTLAIASGGTGATTAAAALGNLGGVGADWCDMLGVALLTARFTESGITYQQTPGDLVLCLCTASKTKSISSLAAWVTAGGATASGVNALMLFDEAGNLIDQTGDMSSAWSAPGMVEGAMGSSHTVTAGVGYYLGFLTHFSGTAPHFAATGTAQTANFPLANGHRTAIFKSGQASVPLSIDPSSYTPNSGYFIMYAR